MKKPKLNPGEYCIKYKHYDNDEWEYFDRIFDDPDEAQEFAEWDFSYVVSSNGGIAVLVVDSDDNYIYGYDSD